MNRYESVIQQQVGDGELKSVEYSDWVVPIVIVRKRMEKSEPVKAINPHLWPKIFLLPTQDEVFSTLDQDESFSILDLAHAYKQMEVLADNQPYLKINTHICMGLIPAITFWYCCCTCYLAESNVCGTASM